MSKCCMSNACGLTPLFFTNILSNCFYHNFHFTDKETWVCGRDLRTFLPVLYLPNDGFKPKGIGSTTFTSNMVLHYFATFEECIPVGPVCQMLFLAFNHSSHFCFILLLFSWFFFSYCYLLHL